MQLPPQKFPDLDGKVEPRVATEIFLTIKRLYEYIDTFSRKGLDELEKKLIPLSQKEEPINTLKTDDGFSVVVGIAPVDGYITIRDNAGHKIKLLVTN